MSRRGNCHDNAVAESFFQLLKRERIKKKIYGTREEARSDIFDYIEMFYNSKRRHGSSDKMPPAEYENQYYQRLGSVQIIRGDSEPLNKRMEKHLDNLIDEISFMGIKTFQEIKDLIPNNYANVFNAYDEKSNVLGFIRDLLLIRDFRKLSECHVTNWDILSDDSDDDERMQRIQFFTNFMSVEEAEELVRTYSI